MIDLFVAIFADPSNPSRGFLNPATKERGAPHPGMAEGKGRTAPPLPVRTIDKKWMGRVKI